MWKKLDYLIESSSQLAVLRLIHQHIRNSLYSDYFTLFYGKQDYAAIVFLYFSWDST